MMKLCEHNKDIKKCKLCSIYENTQKLIKKDLLQDW